MMSHEIRTPLNCVVAMASLLEGTELDTEQLESVQMIISSGHLLACVVNDVLDFSSLQSGNLPIVISPTSLSDTINTVVKAMEVKARSRSIQISTHLDSSLPETMLADGSRLQQILYNLLGNAVKFSKVKGDIDFNISAYEGNIRFAVKDYGRGIKQDDLAKIFEPFNQGSEGIMKVYGGTGLGLAITLKLVEAMGGTIHAASEYSRWSEFVVLMPIHNNDEGLTEQAKSVAASHPDNARRPLIRQDEEVTTSIASKEKATVALGNIRVLVADDNVVNQKILQRMMQRLGVGHIAIASNGLESVDLESKQTFDLVLMDMQMPVMDGIEATTHILGRTRLEGELPPKIVFVTAHASDNYRQQAMDAGGSGFVCKPFNLQKIQDLFQLPVLQPSNQISRFQL
jgi:CheY-like chemotaxis protein